MKYSLSCRQPEDILIQADEIYLHYRDINILDEIIEKYSKKNIAIILPEDKEIDWNFIKACSTQAKYLTCECNTLDHITNCKTRNINFYYSQSINSFYDLNQMIEFGVDSVYIGPGLFFEYDSLRKKIPVRLIPNVVNNNAMHVDSGVQGAWIRPEDIDLYDNNDICRFYLHTDDNGSALIQERTLFLVYSQMKRWPGQVNKIIQNIDIDCLNGAIDDNFGRERLNCKNICQKTGGCNFCNRVITLSKTIENYKKTK